MNVTHLIATSNHPERYYLSITETRSKRPADTRNSSLVIGLRTMTQIKRCRPQLRKELQAKFFRVLLTRAAFFNAVFFVAAAASYTIMALATGPSVSTRTH